ncbi:MAG: hypothetical protein IKK65_04150 [Clostridia bacterium]|nr:hypothetical protein [Clostridia bacterium]MBR4117254.1 hypothetical protein [Clostridia bacterium]
MKIKFLGTAAAEAFPAMFCDCENCKKAKALGGINIRTRSQTLIDNNLFIDYPCDTYYHVITHNINLLDVKNVLITHIHDDHFYPNDLNWMARGFSCPPEDWQGITVHGSCDIESPLSEIVANSRGFLRCESHPAFEPFYVGDYKVTALKATHGTENPYIYVIAKENKTLLYAQDTGLLPEETWEYLKNSGLYFDAVVMDCTAGTTDISYSSHMGLPRNIKTRDEMFACGLVDGNTKFILNHFSHNGGDAVYDDFVPIAKENGFITSYEGLEIEI